MDESEKHPEYRHPVTGEVADPTQALEEGLFYERTFGPVKVEVREKEGEKGEYMILTDANGETMTITDLHAQMHIRHFFCLYKGESVSELGKKTLAEQSEFLTKYAEAREEPLKFHYDPQSREFVAVTSLKHKQISWRQIQDVIEGAIGDVYGTVDREDSIGVTNTWSYKMPVKSDLVSLWAHVQAGNNLKKGRSAIRISTRIRTEFDRSSGGVAAPCLNWANLWQQPLRWFNVVTKRIQRVADQVVEGMPRLTAADFHRYDIHIEATELEIEDFKRRLKRLKDLAESVVVKEFIESSIQEPLSFEEAHAILEAYKTKVGGLPAYAINAILTEFNRARDETVWGFSQAVSYVRTHGELRGSKPRDAMTSTRVLENIAGEILSLSPTIAEFHDKAGPITYEKLRGHPKAGPCPECGKIMAWNLLDDETFREECPSCKTEGRTTAPTLFLANNIQFTEANSRS